MLGQTDSTRSALRLITLVLLVWAPLSSRAASPVLDASFGTNGIVEQPFVGKGGEVGWLLTQPGGRILALGSYTAGYGSGPFGQIFPYFRSAIAPYRFDGTLDVDFGKQGIIDSPSDTWSFGWVQRDGKLIGTTMTGLARYNLDGSPDAGFATDGAAGIAWYSGAGAFAQQADGRIVVASTVGAGIGVVVVLRFDTDGSLDTAFNYVGAVIAPLGNSQGDTCAGLAITPDGKIVVAATANGPGYAQALALIQYNSDGSLDSTFGDGGRASIPLVAGVRDAGKFLVRQPSGRLIVVGSRLFGFAPDGKPDTRFGTGGTTSIDGNPSDVKVHIDGGLLVAMERQDYVTHLVRYTVDGVPDLGFGSAGTLASPMLPKVTSLSLQADGDFVLGGSSAAGNFAVARYASGPVAAVEYFNAALDHYFMTLNPYEAGDLDLGVHGGWTRHRSIVFGVRQ